MFYILERTKMIRINLDIIKIRFKFIQYFIRAIYRFFEFLFRKLKMFHQCLFFHFSLNVSYLKKILEEGNFIMCDLTDKFSL